MAASTIDSRRAWVRLAAAVVALGTAGCGTFRGQYEPQVPMGARTGDVAVRLTQVAIGREREFVFATVADRPHGLRQAWLTVATRAPCSGGERVEELVVDDGQLGVLPVGTHELRASVPARQNDFSLDTVMDFEIEEGGCLRTPVVSQSVPLVGRRRLILLVASSADANTALSGLATSIAPRIGVGAWFGPTLVTGELGVSLAQCETKLCGETENGGKHYRTSVSAAAAAHLVVASGHIWGEFSNARLGARYSYAPVILPVPGGDRRFDVHGFQAVLGWGVGFTPPGPFRHQERGPMLELNFPIGVLYAPGAPDERTAFVAGFEFRLLLPI